jgi:hypothetical protein
MLAREFFGAVSEAERSDGFEKAHRGSGPGEPSLAVFFGVVLQKGKTKTASLGDGERNCLKGKLGLVCCQLLLVVGSTPHAFVGF